MSFVVISDHNRICDCLSNQSMRVIFNREYDSEKGVSRVQSMVGRNYTLKSQLLILVSAVTSNPHR